MKIASRNTQREANEHCCRTCSDSTSLQTETTAAPMSSRAAILQLQRVVGNRATQRLLRTRFQSENKQAPVEIQAKLQIDPPDSPLEKEADRVSNQVLSMPSLKAKTNSSACEQEDCPIIQRKALPQRPTLLAGMTATLSGGPQLREEIDVCGDYKAFDYVATEQCGIIDWGHQNPANARELIEKVRNASELLRFDAERSQFPAAAAVAQHQQRSSLLGIEFNAFQTRFSINQPLTESQALSVALGIFTHISLGFEEQQASVDWMKSIVGKPSSSFAGEDLPSNWMSFYRAAKGWSPDQLLEICGCIQNLDEGSNERNESFKPLRQEWPKDLRDLKPEPPGKLWNVLSDEPRGLLGVPKKSEDGGNAAPQRKRAGGASAKAEENLESQVAFPEGRGEPLVRSALDFLEPRFGVDFGQVRIHADRKAAQSAAALNARAYTFGHHIVFGRGEFQPTSREGRRLIAHELVHVLQQKAVVDTHGTSGRTAVRDSVHSDNVRSATAKTDVNQPVLSGSGVIRRKPAAAGGPDDPECRTLLEKIIELVEIVAEKFQALENDPNNEYLYNPTITGSGGDKSYEGHQKNLKPMHEELKNNIDIWDDDDRCRQLQLTPQAVEALEDARYYSKRTIPTQPLPGMHYESIDADRRVNYDRFLNFLRYFGIAVAVIAAAWALFVAGTMTIPALIAIGISALVANQIMSALNSGNSDNTT